MVNVSSTSMPTSEFPRVVVPPPPYYDKAGQESSIKDTREFMKTSYSANLKTRDVPSVVTSVKNIVKGADGRVDDIYSSERSGRIGFVVPKSNFEQFKSEVEAVVHRKLYFETISSTNLLSQKQNIEAQTTDVLTALQSLKSQKASLDDKHTRTVATINRDLLSIQSQIIVVRQLIATTTDQNQMSALRSQESNLANRESALKQNLSAENYTYSVQSTNLANQISNQNNNLTNITKVDTQFTNNIETVNGNISVNWVSLWELATIFSPISPVIIIIILAIILWIYLGKIGIAPKFIFV